MRRLKQAHFWHEPTQRRRSTYIRFACAALLLALSLGSNVFFFAHAQYLFPTYRHVSRTILSGLAYAVSFVPFALWDWCALILLLSALIGFVVCIRRHISLVVWLSHVLLVICVLLFVFIDAWALNHYAPPLNQELKLEVDSYSKEELCAATRAYVLEAAARAENVPRDANGHLVRQDFQELSAIAGKSYTQLGESYDVFRGSSVPVKELTLFGTPLLYTGYVGMFVAPLGEASVASACAVVDMPFTQCHEAAHRLGIASEKEANFSAFLACTTYEDLRFQYSGFYNAFVYCYNALYAQDSELALAVVRELLESPGVHYVLTDMEDTANYYEQFKAPQSALIDSRQLGDFVNQTYLSSMGEKDGIRSYGLVVDYLIAWQLR